MIAKIDNDNGSITMTTEVIANIAGISAMRCYGVVGMASRNTTDGLASLLKIEALSRGVKVVVQEDCLTVDLHIITEYGVNISVICTNIKNSVRYKLETITGLQVKEVNIYVESIRVEQ